MTMPATASTLSTTIQRLRELARRAGLAGFWSWWGRELWSWVPARVRGAVARRATRPVLAFDDGLATLWQPAAGGALRMVETARIALDGDAVAVGAEGRAVMASIARGVASQPRVVVAVPARSALRKTLTLPDALEENLRQALAYDLDRHTPFQSADLYFDAVVTGRDAPRRTMQVELVAARRNLVDPLIARAEEFGADVVAVTSDPPERAAWSKVDLLSDERRASRHPWSRWQVIVPALVLVALVFAALFLPVWQKRGEAIALMQIAEAARHRADATDALRSELERKVAEYNFPLVRKYGYPGTVQLINDVTHILPDDTWLTQLEYHAGRGNDTTHTVALRGESANAGKLVALLQDSKLFTQAAPRSPITKIQPGPGEIFDIGAQVEPYAAPKPAPIDLSAPPPPRPAVAPRPATRASPVARPGPAAAPPAAAPSGATAPSAPSQSPRSAMPPGVEPMPQPAEAPDEGESTAPADASPPTGPAATSPAAPAATQPQTPVSTQPSAPPQEPPATAPAQSGFGPFPSTPVARPHGSKRQP